MNKQAEEAKKRAEEVLKRRLEGRTFSCENKRPTEPKACCEVCGGYVQKSAAHLSRKYQELLMGEMCCIYCLSRALERSVEELKEEYSCEK